MSVYVDHARNRYGRMLLNHMMADTTDELLEMVSRLGLSAQDRHHDHFDVCEAKRRKAIALGALPVRSGDLVELRRRQRAEAKP